MKTGSVSEAAEPLIYACNSPSLYRDQFSHLFGLRRLLDFERSGNQGQGSEFFSRVLSFMRWFPVASLTNDVLIATRAGSERATPLL